MQKFINTTKTILATTAFVSVLSLSAISTSALNPVSEVNNQLQNVAGVQDAKVNYKKLKLYAEPSLFHSKENGLSFDIKAEQSVYNVGEIAVTNDSNSKVFGKLEVEIEPALKNKIRIELYDENNTILLSDFNKDFEFQKITLEAESTKLFKVRYILAQPINYSSLVSINVL